MQMEQYSEENRKLYPLRFVEAGRDLFWGHLDYCISDDAVVDTVVRDGWLGGNTLGELLRTFHERIAGDNVFDSFGFQFPVMVNRQRFFERQPLTIGLSDEAAIDCFDSLGKKALWYIRKAQPGAVIHLGFSRDLDAGELWRRCEDGTVEEVLNAVHPKEGEFYLVNPGTVYSCGPGLDIVEIAEDSVMSNELYNWGRDIPGEEPLLLDQSLAFIDYSRLEPKPLEGDVLASGPEFHANRVDLKAPVHISTGSEDTFNIYCCLAGEASLQYQDGEGEMKELVLPEGDTVMLPPEIDDYYLAPLKAGTLLAEVFMERLEVADPYLGGSADSDETPEADPHEMTWS